MYDAIMETISLFLKALPLMLVLYFGFRPAMRFWCWFYGYFFGICRGNRHS